MAEQGYATQTTTTTVSSSAARPYFDISFVKSPIGILIIVIIVVDLIGEICIASDYPSGPGSWYHFVAIVGFIVHICLLCLYLFHVPGVLHNIPWFLMEFIYCAVWCFFFFTAGIAVAVRAARYHGYYHSGHAAAAFFGFLAMILYGFQDFMRFRSWRNGERPQVTVVSQASHVTTVTAGQQQPQRQDPKY